MAWQFAPVVYHHPLEKYHLIDPREWYNASELYLQARRRKDTTARGCGGAAVLAFGQRWRPVPGVMPEFRHHKLVARWPRR